MQSDEYLKNKEELLKLPDIQPLILGTSLERPLLRENIKKRLDERFKCL